MKTKPQGISLLIGIGTPQSQFAHDGNQDHGDGDIATDAICGVVQSMYRGGPSTVRDLRAFIDALESMCQAFMDEDRSGFEDAASDACEALRTLVED